MGCGDPQLWGPPVAAKWLFLFVLGGNRSRTRRIRSSEKKRKFHEHFLYAGGWLSRSYIISFPFREGRASRHPRVQMRKLRLSQEWRWRALHSACGTARDRASV